MSRRGPVPKKKMLKHALYAAALSLPPEGLACLASGVLHRPSKTGVTQGLLFPGSGVPPEIVSVQQGPLVTLGTASACLRSSVLFDALGPAVIPGVRPALDYLLASKHEGLPDLMLVSREIIPVDRFEAAAMTGFDSVCVVYFLGDRIAMDYDTPNDIPLPYGVKAELDSLPVNPVAVDLVLGDIRGPVFVMMNAQVAESHGERAIMPLGMPRVCVPFLNTFQFLVC